MTWIRPAVVRKKSLRLAVESLEARQVQTSSLIAGAAVAHPAAHHPAVHQSIPAPPVRVEAPPTVEAAALGRQSGEFAKAQAISVADLKPGDVLLCVGNSVQSRVIQFGTASMFNHAALYVGTQTVNGAAVPAIIDYTGKGCVRRSLAEEVDSQQEVYIVRRDSLSDQQRSAIVAEATKSIGGAYSYASLIYGQHPLVKLYNNIPFKDPGASRKFCSEAIWDWYKLGAKQQITSFNIPTPGDLGAASGPGRYFRIVGRLK